MTIRPLRDLLYVEKIRPTHSPGGLLHLPSTFRAGKGGHSAREKMNATADHFPAKVLAVGPQVREVKPGDTVLVWTFAEGDGSKLWTGDSVGEKDRLFIKPDDIVCAQDVDA